ARTAGGPRGRCWARRTWPPGSGWPRPGSSRGRPIMARGSGRGSSGRCRACPSSGSSTFGKGRSRGPRAWRRRSGRMRLFAAEDGEGLLAEEAAGAEEAHGHGQEGGGGEAGGEGDGGPAEADLEGEAKDGPSQDGSEGGAAEPGARAEQRVLHGEHAGDEATGGAEGLQDHRLVEALVARDAERPGHHDEAAQDAEGGDQAHGQRDL